MLALYRSGRQADALELYRRTRQTFVDELGIEPGPELQELERRILRQDPELRPTRAAAPVGEPRTAVPRGRWPLALVAVLLVALAAAALAVALTRRGTSSASGDAELRTFVTKLENFLAQSREGRRQVGATLNAAFSCKLAPRRAAVALDGVQRNRQSVLQQIAAVAVPDRERALRASDLLQQALAASIAADSHYHDWLAGRKRCGPPDRSPELRAARAADARATRVKREFLAVFDPLARRFGARVWTADQF
jgi:hypothetical protein